VPRKRANGEGTIRLRPDGRWEGLYTHNDKRKSIYGKTQAEVRKKLNKVTNDIGVGSYIGNHNMTLGQWLDTWLETYAKPVVRTSTYASYETFIRGHIKPELGRIKLQDLRTDTLQKFLNKKQTSGRLDGEKGGLSTKTIRNILNMLKTSLRQAQRNSVIGKNVADLVILPKQIKPEILVLTVAEQKLLEEKCWEHHKGTGIILALYSGVRIGELLGLRWSDIDFETENMYIRRTLNRLPVHNNPDRKTDIVIGKPKSASGSREIPLQGFLIPLLKELQEQQKTLQLAIGSEPVDEDYVICNEQGRHIEPRTYQDFFKKMLREAGVRSTNFHTLRHTFATRALEGGLDVKVVSDILGHADASTTLNMYAHALPDHKRASMNKLKPLRGA
jgi:integrase